MAADPRMTVVTGDITAQQVDAVVNAANAQLAPGGGVAGAIHRAAGPGLHDECRPLAPIGTGECVVTGGHDLPAPHVIHCLGPVWHGGDRDEPALLARCYERAIQLAAQKGLRSMAFPAISTGAFGYPLEHAIEIAVQSVQRGLQSVPDMREVRFVAFDHKTAQVFETKLASL